MSYEQTAQEGTGHKPFGNQGYRHFREGSDPMGWARRPGFNPMKALAVVAGFAIFPPLGVGALAWFIWNERRGRHAGPGYSAFDGEGRRMCGGHGRRGWRTGNAAFDEHSAAVMEKLAEERIAFHEYRAEQRRKRDQEAFDAFQASRATKADDAGKAG
jgi:hypothetical protein